MNFAGVGSRKTPENHLENIRYIGWYLCDEGWHLHTGGADGADAAFAERVNDDDKTIYLPWKNFNNVSNGVVIPETMFPKYNELLPFYHPAAGFLKRGARLLHYRNLAIVLGINLDKPVDAIICYTDKGKIKGGTATAMRIGLDMIHAGFDDAIPVYNLAITHPDEILLDMEKIKNEQR